MQSFQVTSAREIQRNYRKLFDSVKKTRKPLYVMKGTDVDVVVVDPKTYDEMQEAITLIGAQSATDKNSEATKRAEPTPPFIPAARQSGRHSSSPHIPRVPWRK